MSAADPFEIFQVAQARLTARGPRGWDIASTFAAGPLGVASDAMRLGACEMATFARVTPAAGDPRRFVLAADGAGEPAMLAPWPYCDELWMADDLIAISLTRRRFWRLTCAAMGWSHGPDPFGASALRLRQDARGYLADLVRWKAGGDGAGHPNPAPAGVLVLDPAAIDWTRRGWLKGVETVEILDAPATGALGSALRKLNPMIGSPRGAALVGTERAAAQPRQRRAA